MKKEIIILFLSISLTSLLVFYNGQKELQKDITTRSSKIDLSPTISFQTTVKGEFITSDPSVNVLEIPLEDYSLLTETRGNEVIYTKNNLQEKVLYNKHPLFSIQKSPSGQKVAFFYYPDSGLDDIALIISDPYKHKEHKIYDSKFSSWDVRSRLQWLGNNYVFFKRNCGTACQGITLINIDTKEIKNAVVAYPSLPEAPFKTYFKDWFGQEFTFDGLGSEVYSKVQNGESYIIFKIENKEGKPYGEKRFRFTGSSLKEL